MAATQSTQKGFGLLGDFEKWIAQKQDDVGRLADHAVAAGRDAWTQATQAGQNLFASQPSASTRPNGNPAPKAPAPNSGLAIDGNAVARRLGNVVGVGRGVFHSAEGLLGSAEFIGQLVNPVNQIVNPPGSRATDRIVNAANQTASYLVNGALHPGSVVQDAKDAIHRLHVDVDPDASPPAATPDAEFQRNFNIGQNQGELGYDAGSLLFGSAASKVLGRLRPVPEAVAIAKFVRHGETPAEAKYLAQPYVGMGHHAVITRGGKFPHNVMGIPLPPNIAGQRLPKVILQSPFMESPFNVLKPININRGDFYELHYRVDPSANVMRMPDRFGRPWDGRTKPFEKYGLLGRVWHGTPAPLNAAVGIAGAAGLATFAKDDEDGSQ